MTRRFSPKIQSKTDGQCRPKGNQFVHLSPLAPFLSFDFPRMPKSNRDNRDSLRAPMCCPPNCNPSISESIPPKAVNETNVIPLNCSLPFEKSSSKCKLLVPLGQKYIRQETFEQPNLFDINTNSFYVPFHFGLVCPAPAPRRTLLVLLMVSTCFQLSLFNHKAKSNRFNCLTNTNENNKLERKIVERDATIWEVPIWLKRDMSSPHCDTKWIFVNCSFAWLTIQYLLPKIAFTIQWRIFYYNYLLLMWNSTLFLIAFIA